jgi:hypothetical protein
MFSGSDCQSLIACGLGGYSQTIFQALVVVVREVPAG